MKKNLLLSALIIPAALAMTSCMDSDGNRQEANINFGGSLCFNYVTDIKDPTVAPFVSLAPQYSFNVEYYGGTITTSMSNIRLTSDGQQLSFRTPELKASNTNNGYTLTCTGSDIVPEGQSQSFVFDDFSVNITERSIVNASGAYRYSPVYAINYLVNGRYRVKVFPTYYDVVGKMTSTATVDKTAKTSERAIVSFSLNPDSSNPVTGKATIEINDVTFADNFTVSRLIASDVPYTVNATGISIRTDSETVYKVKDALGRDLPNAGLSDIVISIDVPSGSTSISMHANVTGLEGEKDAVEYDLRATLGYFINTTN